MAYHEGFYLFAFLPLALICYQIVAEKHRWKVLLVFSFISFYLFSGQLVLYMIGSTVLTHYASIWISWIKMKYTQELLEVPKEKKSAIRKAGQKKQRMVLTIAVLALLGLLAYLKYSNFFLENMNSVLAALNVDYSFTISKILVPIGISFYTLEQIGYIADVYWDKIEPEKNLGKLMLFFGFFPLVMEGPISSYESVSKSLFSGQKLNFENLKDGFLRIVWGLMKKMVVADRLYVLVDKVFSNYQDYSGVIIILAAVCYTIQLYMEFSGCMDIVIGSGKLFGVELPENFKQPFFSKNAGEFWRRWHISLGTWFRTYIFYPVSVSKLVKKWNKFGNKKVGKNVTRIVTSAFTLFPVWLCNGLWHGANWSYIFYGMYYFVILMIEVIVEPLTNKLTKKYNLDTLRIFKTWIIIFTGELFFRAESLPAGISMFTSIFTDFIPENIGSISLGIGYADVFAIVLGCVLVGIVSTLKEKNIDLKEKLSTLKTPVRWAVYYALIFMIIILGAYGTGYQPVDLIYAGF